MYNSRLLHLLCLFLLVSCTGNSQKLHLEGLRLLTEEEQIGKPITINANIPSYTEKGEQIKKSDWGRYMTNDLLKRDIYIDTTGEIKAMVFSTKTKISSEIQNTAKWEFKDLTGQQSIDFTNRDVNGNVVKLSSLKGKIVILNFWFIACKPCIMEMPQLNELKKKYKKDDVVFLGITFDKAPEVLSFLKINNFDYNIIADGKEICKSWNINAFPTNVVIDREGIVRFMEMGFGENIQRTLDQQIQSIAKSK
jgi:peroxiredoxin